MTNTKMYNRNGTLTTYGLACGYVEMYGDWLGGAGVRLFREGCYHVRGAFGDHRVWETFGTVAEARAFARRLAPFVPAPDAFEGG